MSRFIEFNDYFFNMDDILHIRIDRQHSAIVVTFKNKEYLSFRYSNEKELEGDWGTLRVKMFYNELNWCPSDYFKPPIEDVKAFEAEFDKAEFDNPFYVKSDSSIRPV